MRTKRQSYAIKPYAVAIIASLTVIAAIRILLTQTASKSTEETMPLTSNKDTKTSHPAIKESVAETTPRDDESSIATTKRIRKRQPNRSLIKNRKPISSNQTDFIKAIFSCSPLIDIAALPYNRNLNPRDKQPTKSLTAHILVIKQEYEQSLIPRLELIERFKRREIRELIVKGGGMQARVTTRKIPEKLRKRLRAQFPNRDFSKSTTGVSIPVPHGKRRGSQDRSRADAWIHDGKAGMVYGAFWEDIPQVAAKHVELLHDARDMLFRIVATFQQHGYINTRDFQQLTRRIIKKYRTLISTYQPH